MPLIPNQISNYTQWSEIRQSIPVFTPLIDHIMQKEKLPLAKIEELEPGMHAIFKVGDCVVKIFAPIEHSGKIIGEDYERELHGIKWASACGVRVPKLLAHGTIEDLCSFQYMIMELLPGDTLGNLDAEGAFSYKDKVAIGQKMRELTDKLNLPCDGFKSHDILSHALKNPEWREEGYPHSFLEELADYLKNVQIGAKVYCHGDLHADNVLADESLSLAIIDFAESVNAPIEYEHAYVACALFAFEKPYMEGYFGEDYVIQDILDLCMAWLPIHAWGHDLLEEIGPAEEITSFAVLRERLTEWIEEGLEEEDE